MADGYFQHTLNNQFCPVTLLKIKKIKSSESPPQNIKTSSPTFCTCFVCFLFFFLQFPLVAFECYCISPLVVSRNCMIAVSCHTTIYVTTCSEKKETKKSTKSVILFSLGSQESPGRVLFVCFGLVISK